METIISRQDLDQMLANGTAVYIGCDGNVDVYHIALGEWESGECSGQLIGYCEVPCDL